MSSVWRARDPERLPRRAGQVGWRVEFDREDGSSHTLLVLLTEGSSYSYGRLKASMRTLESRERLPQKLLVTPEGELVEAR